MISTLARSLGTIALIGLATAPPAWAQWTTNTSQNTLVSTAPVTSRPAMIRGANGGTFVLWEDVGTAEVFLQFIDGSGFRRPVDRLVDDQSSEAVMASDGAGGVFVVWRRMPGSIMIQRFDDQLDPHPQWFQSAIYVASTGGTQRQPAVIADGAGGVIVSWTDDSQDPQGDVRAQRFAGLSLGQWGSGGRVLCNETGQQSLSALATDGAGGAFAVWEDDRNDTGDIFAQHIDASGMTQWPSPASTLGSAVYVGSHWQHRPLVVSDDNGGFIAAWYHQQSVGSKLAARRVFGSGLLAWSGVRILGDLAGWASGALSYGIDRDGQGGAVLAWTDDADIRGQRLSGAGSTLWGTNGTPVTAGGHSNLRRIHPAIAGFGDGGAVIAWSTSADWLSINPNVYTLEVRALGQVAGIAGGDVVSDAADRQKLPSVLTEGRCRSKFAWADNRPGGADGVYTHRRDRRLFLCVVRKAPEVAVGDHFPTEDMMLVPIAQGPNGVSQGFQNGEFEVAYDPDLFALVDVRFDSGALSTTAVAVDTETPGLVRVESWGGVAVEPGGTLFELVLAPLAGAGDALLSLTTARLDGEPVLVEGARVEIEP